ncbi:MAG TPA: NAD(P)H-hydrate dehydratase [Dongiaceae bacterium]|nr:NAD(P)H-hydrate dehydratase [Dongiaceae bacterium]
MKALTAAEMREVDRLTTERFGVPGLELMEAAGRGVAEEFLEKYGHQNPEPPRRVVVLCGKGNNGGDGFVVARYLKEEADEIEAYLFAKPEELRGDARKNYERWRDLGGAVTIIENETEWQKAWSKITTSEVLIDALLGTGVRGPVTGLFARAIEDINRLSGGATLSHPAWIVAVDTPSGLPSDGEETSGPVLHAHLTVTFTAPKIGQLVSKQAPACGLLLVRGIGSPDALVEEVGQSSLRWAGPDEFANMPLIRAADAHKGSYGHLLLVGGCVGKTGAAVLAGQAALRTGAGLVTIATPDPALPVVASVQPEYMTEPLPATHSGSIAKSAFTSEAFRTVLKDKDVLAIGPGLGQHPPTQEFICQIVAEGALPTVLDADGLNAFSSDGDALARRKSPYLVITPHPGEMARLLGTSIAEVQKDRVKTAVDAARRFNAHIVLKGFHSIIASPEGKVFVNTTGGPALAKGGSGDVLTGHLGALICQFGTQDLHRVVALGVYLHGLAADLLAESAEPSGIVAGEVAQALPYARRKLLQELQQRA